MLLYFLLISASVTKKYNIHEGEIAKYDIKAPRDIKDETTTNALVKQAIKGVSSQYVKKSEVAIEAIDEVNTFFKSQSGEGRIN